MALHQKSQEQLKEDNVNCFNNSKRNVCQEEKPLLNEDSTPLLVKVSKTNSPMKEKRISTPTAEIVFSTSSSNNQTKLSSRSDPQIKLKPHPNTAPMKRYVDKTQVGSIKQRTNSTAFCNNLVSNIANARVETTESDIVSFNVNESHQGNLADIVRKKDQKNEYFSEGIIISLSLYLC